VNTLPHKWTIEKEKTVLQKNKWLIDSGLVFLYSALMVSCFFILTSYGGWVLLFAVLSSLSLTILCISYVLSNLTRTLRILFFGSLLGFVLAFAAKALYVYHFASYPNYIMASSEELEKTRRMADCLTMYVGFMILVLVLGILSAIMGNYIVERTREGEKRLTLRCYNCGSWNEQDAVNCGYCGKNLDEEHNDAEKNRTRTKAKPSS